MERLRGDRTQRSVAQRAGINRSSWSSYEAGRRMPGPDTYSKIARGLECDEDDLDRAVVRVWNERLRGEGKEADAVPWTDLNREPAPGNLCLTPEEAVGIAGAAERIQQVIRALLRRHEN